MELSVQNVYGLLLRSKLLSPDEAKAMFERWQAQAKDPANVAEFARWMVAAGYLTDYQATLLARGHADCFFLNQYKVLDRLGKGRMAGVYRAVHRLGQVVAIKVLPPSKAKDPHLLARFQREARLALKLKHPNVVRTFQVGETGGLHYLVMECLEGETLAEVMQRRGKMPPTEAVRLVYQALLGLQHLHEQGFVHRDIKPSNLMVLPPPNGSTETTTVRSVVKLLDMSLARALSDEEGEEEADPRLTTEGTLLGTPDYMAPEQARDAHSADIRADIYSFGCVLYTLIAGQTPFPDSNIISQMIRHASEAPRALKEFNPAVPDGLQQAIAWMMAKDPAKRAPTPERAAQALRPYLTAGAEAVPSPDADPKMRSYLTWLEMGEEGTAALARATPAAAPPSAPVPAAAPAPAPVPSRPPMAVPVAPEPAKAQAVAKAAAPPKPQAAPAAAVKSRPEKERRRAPAAQPAPAPREAGSFDVELLPTDSAPSREAPSGGLTRRDCVMFGLGAGSVIVAVALGGLMALLLRS